MEKLNLEPRPAAVGASAPAGEKFIFPPENVLYWNQVGLWEKQVCGLDFSQGSSNPRCGTNTAKYRIIPV